MTTTKPGSEPASSILAEYAHEARLFLARPVLTDGEAETQRRNMIDLLKSLIAASEMVERRSDPI